MLKPGKMQEIAEQIQNTSQQIAALQEIDGKGMTHQEKYYSLYYSCNPDSTGHLGTGFSVNTLRTGNFHKSLIQRKVAIFF
jgi:hypothetical protein